LAAEFGWQMKEHKGTSTTFSDEKVVTWLCQAVSRAKEGWYVKPTW